MGPFDTFLYLLQTRLLLILLERCIDSWTCLFYASIRILSRSPKKLDEGVKSRSEETSKTKREEGTILRLYRLLNRGHTCLYTFLTA